MRKTEVIQRLVTVESLTPGSGKALPHVLKMYLHEGLSRALGVFERDSEVQAADLHMADHALLGLFAGVQPTEYPHLREHLERHILAQRSYLQRLLETLPQRND